VRESRLALAPRRRCVRVLDRKLWGLGECCKLNMSKKNFSAVGLLEFCDSARAEFCAELTVKRRIRHMTQKFQFSRKSCRMCDF
jgi:hypothetical protein